MPREQSDNRKRAREIYEQHNGQIANREIARLLDCSEKSISGWKYKDNWTGSKRSTPSENKRSTPKNKRGGQPGNHNATGPPGNKNAEKHGFFTKWLPEETLEIIGEMPTNPIDALYDQIQLQYAVIIRAQKLMYVKDQEDKTIEKIEEKDGNVIGEKWEVQQAWDKHASFMAAQSRAMATYTRMVKEYDDMLHKNWDTASAIQKAQLDQIRAQTDKLTGNNAEVEDLTETDDMIYEDC